MPQPVFYQTLNMVGIDPTMYYTNLATAGGSVTPEYPAPPFFPGTRAFGSDGSEFIFVQASAAINLTDFVVIAPGAPGTGTYMANQVTTTNATSADVAIASTGMIVKQSVTTIPAGAMFWACTKGQFLPASTSANFAGMSVQGGAVILYTTTSAGQMSVAASVASSVGSVAFAGFTVVNSICVTIPASVVPPVGTLTNGFTTGPVVSLNNPRTIVQIGTSGSLLSSNAAFW